MATPSSKANNNSVFVSENAPTFTSTSNYLKSFYIKFRQPGSNH